MLQHDIFVNHMCISILAPVSPFLAMASRGAPAQCTRHSHGDGTEQISFMRNNRELCRALLFSHLEASYLNHRNDVLPFPVPLVYSTNFSSVHMATCVVIASICEAFPGLVHTQEPASLSARLRLGRRSAYTPTAPTNIAPASAAYIASK